MLRGAESVEEQPGSLPALKIQWSLKWSTKPGHRVNVVNGQNEVNWSVRGVEQGAVLRSVTQLGIVKNQETSLTCS